ncbi:helix-turn-helix domain-containing protein [Bacillus sp. CDB3]|uniref:helix-turn-helix domain-containing protein n=1 Tax=Bacillus sp. CDB3 TaxID=360310 RepID=UPI0009D82075|nr:helix-turn-helix transcriptional regulator [Bacillus sp. CDB3]OQR53537.1 transcriptional regulator [Bacillus sp. CDB3]
MNVGFQLKQFRELKNFSQEDVARKIGVTKQAVCNWENNKSYPEINNLILLSELYEAKIDELIKGSEELDKKDTDECEDDENDFSLVIGSTLFCISMFVDNEGISAFLMCLGILFMAFYSDVKKAIINEFKPKRRSN